MSLYVHPLVTPFDVTLVAYQGATFRFQYAWKLKDSVGVLTPVNLTGCQARARFWAAAGDTAPLFPNLTTENSGIVLGGALGTIELHISDEQTAVLPETKRGRWTLEIAWGDGDVTRLMEGLFQVRLSKASG